MNSSAQVYLVNYYQIMIGTINIEICTKLKFRYEPRNLRYVNFLITFSIVLFIFGVCNVTSALKGKDYKRDKIT